MRDAAGEARLVGNVSHVATQPEARRRGHATRLMALAIDVMRADGCVWATLNTSEEARPLYERLGCAPIRDRAGRAG
jgi:ribosomal protein S18 acetylase RimI-like enzyme